MILKSLSLTLLTLGTISVHAEVSVAERATIAFGDCSFIDANSRVISSGRPVPNAERLNTQSMILNTNSGTFILNGIKELIYIPELYSQVLTGMPAMTELDAQMAESVNLLKSSWGNYKPPQDVVTKLISTCSKVGPKYTAALKSLLTK